jgi:hypothetical protein
MLLASLNRAISVVEFLDLNRHYDLINYVVQDSFGNLLVAKLIKRSPAFMEPRGLLPCSQKPGTGFFP